MTEVSVHQRPRILIVDLGSQYTLLIEKAFRELGYRSAILDPKKAVKWAASNEVWLVVLSGGPKSVTGSDRIEIPQEIFEINAPIFAICYGMQYVAQFYGGEVGSVQDHRGYGPETIKTKNGSKLFANLPVEQPVWASHGDTVARVPDGFTVTARTSKTEAIAAMEGKRKNGQMTYCVQFHPEVHHTQYGRQIFNTLAQLSFLKEDWSPRDMVQHLQNAIIEGIGDRDTITGFSGGVDSSTLARIITRSKLLKKRAHFILIDGGQLREGELEEIRENAKLAGVENLIVVDAKKRFAKALGKTTDAEEVPRVFRRLYSQILQETALLLTGGDLKKIVLLQGTLAPDRIESGATGGALIKTHHNVNLDTGEMPQMHPLQDLFKYEVRALARALRLPKQIWNRQPSPGPGLFIRAPGHRKTPEIIAVVRWADARTKDILIARRWYGRVSQLVVYYENVNLVGVRGDSRHYDSPIVVRAVKTIDFMTADGVIFPPKVQKEIISALTQHPHISRVHFDPTPKPPGTTEPE